MRALAIAALVAVPFLPAALAVDASVGDHWDYRGTFTLGNETASLARITRVVAREQVVVANATYAALRLETTEQVSTPGRSIALTRTTEWVAPGGGTVRAVERHEAGGASVTTTYEYEAPCARLPATREPGATVAWSCALVATRDGNRSSIADEGFVIVGRREPVESPAGNFSATYVEARRAGCAACIDQVWLAEETCRAVKTATVGSRGERFELALVDYRCAAAEPKLNEPAPAAALALATIGGAALLARRASKRS